MATVGRSRRFRSGDSHLAGAPPRQPPPEPRSYDRRRHRVPALLCPALACRSGPAATPLDPLVSARLDKIIQSELLGPVPHPMPPALMGIAGLDAFVRTSSGMSGLVHEGADFGGMKLLRIGTNRVLVEEGGVKKELMIFGGEGGASLMTP